MIRTRDEAGVLVVEASANGGGVWHEVDRLTPDAAGNLQRDVAAFLSGKPFCTEFVSDDSEVYEVRAVVVMPGTGNARARGGKGKTLARIVHTAFGGAAQVFLEGRLVEYDPKAPGGGG